MSRERPYGKAQHTRTFEATLSDGTQTDVEARWDYDAEFYVGREQGQSVYFKSNGEQI